MSRYALAMPGSELAKRDMDLNWHIGELSSGGSARTRGAKAANGQSTQRQGRAKFSIGIAPMEMTAKVS